MPERKRIAAIITEYKALSHADVIVTKYLKGFPTDEGFFAPRVDIASMYIDQFPDEDIGRQIADETWGAYLSKHSQSTVSRRR